MKQSIVLLATGWSASNFYTYLIECFDFDITFLILIQFVANALFISVYLFIYIRHINTQHFQQKIKLKN
jgi:hypothetical protein